MAAQKVDCPFCSHEEVEEYMMVYHIEVHHTEDSPFVPVERTPSISSMETSHALVSEAGTSFIGAEEEDAVTKDGPVVTYNRASLLEVPGDQACASPQHEGSRYDEDEVKQYVACTEPECGEVVLVCDLNEHLDFHLAENGTLDEEQNSEPTSSSSQRQRERRRHHSSHHHHRHLSSRHIVTSDSSSTYSSRSRRSGSVSSSSRHRGRATMPLSSPFMSTPDRSYQHSESDLHDDSTPGSHERLVSDSFSTSISPALRHAACTATSPASESPADSVMGTPSRGSRRRKRHHDHGDSARQGKKELGPYAFEEQMPAWLWKKLSDGPKMTKKTKMTRNGDLITQHVVENETPGIVPILARLSELDREVQEAFFCHPAVQHVFALPKEGGFCGYRNIQMLISYLQGTKAYGYEKFPGRTPSIPKLQDLIENAWDRGFNSICRDQTGGIRGTRKYIGTPEAQAFFSSLEIPCVPEQCNPTGNMAAHQILYDAVEAYFRSDVVDDAEDRVRIYKTVLPPLYLQMPGHSVTIVGLEKRHSGSRNLLVLDPMYRTATALANLIGRTDIRSPHPMAIDSCRRGTDRLARHKAFELLKLSTDPPRFPAWDVLAGFNETDFVYAFFDLKRDEYEVYPAHAFDKLFPWFMFGGLFVVREGRFARVSGDASFDRLGVPALGWECNWEKWRQEKDVAPLVFAAQGAKSCQHAEEVTQVVQEPVVLPQWNHEVNERPHNHNDLEAQQDHIQFLEHPREYLHDAAMAAEGRCACTDCVTLLINRKARRQYWISRSASRSSRSSPRSIMAGHQAATKPRPLHSAPRSSTASFSSSLSRSTWMSQYSASDAAWSSTSAPTSVTIPSEASSCSCWDCRGNMPFTPTDQSFRSSMLSNGLDDSIYRHTTTVVFPKPFATSTRVAPASFHTSMLTPTSVCGCPHGWHTAFGMACSPPSLRHSSLSGNFSPRSSDDSGLSFDSNPYGYREDHGGFSSQGTMAGLPYQHLPSSPPPAYTGSVTWQSGPARQSYLVS